MVKSLKPSETKSNKVSQQVSFNSANQAPLLHINDEPLSGNEEVFVPREQDVDRYLSAPDSKPSKKQSKKIKEKVKSKASIDSITSESSESDRDFKKLKKKFGGNNDLAKLVAYLSYDRKPIVEKKVILDDDELELVESLGSAVDLDKFFEPKEKKFNDKLWRIDYNWFVRQKAKPNESVSEKGYRVINRFGDGIPDGCNIKLSLSSKGKSNFEGYLKQPKEWSEILADADNALNSYVNKGNGKNKSPMARRGSLLQPRFLFLSPHPNIGYEKVLRTANCLPLREWTSELFLDSKESLELLDPESKRILKTNNSVEDFRHLLRPELSHFGNDIDSLIVQAKRRLSFLPPQNQSQDSLNFRRKSYMGGAIWNPNLHNDSKKDKYKGKMDVMRQNSSGSTTNVAKSDANASHLWPTNNKSTHSTLNSLFVPNEGSVPVIPRKREAKRLSFKLEETISEIPIDNTDPKTMANELTLIVKELYISIKNVEIITYLMRPHMVNPETCSQLTALFGFQKRIIQLIACNILQETTPINRAQKISFFIEVAEELRELRNWHSLNSVILSLQSPPIARLSKTWHIVSSNYSDEYCEYIDISEVIKRENNQPLDYTSPSIQLYDDLIDDIKERCGSLLFVISKHRLHSNWAKPETLADWVDNEIVDLVNAAKQKKKIKRKVEKLIDLQKPKEKPKGVFSKLLRRKSSKDTTDTSSSSSKSRTNSTNSIASSNSPISRDSSSSLSSDVRLIKSKSYPRDMSTLHSFQPSNKNNWTAKQVQNLSEDQENEIMKEITRALVSYQNNLTHFRLDLSDKKARDFLLYQEYEEMDSSMKRSVSLESTSKSDPQSYNNNNSLLLVDVSFSY